MRFDSVAELYSETLQADPKGNMIRVKGEPREVFANRYEVGMSSYMAAQEAGLHADAEIQVRAIDYQGEEIALMDGIEYTVERVQDSGEFVRLTLARRLSNA